MEEQLAGEDGATRVSRAAWAISPALTPSRVQVQVLLLFLLLSLPGAPAPTEAVRSAPELPPSLSPSKSKKRKRRGSSPVPPPVSMQDRLESFMDKMSMWQLMSSIDEEEDKRAQGGRSDAKGKQKAVDERDWMQIFCEDVVEPKYDFTISSVVLISLFCC